jgi:hypothetical protein
MPRRIRLQIAIALCVLVAGVAFAYGAPLTIAFLYFKPQSEALFAQMSETPEVMLQGMTTLQQTAQTANVLAIVGWCVAAAGGLSAFTTWVFWFAGNDSNPVPIQDSN